MSKLTEMLGTPAGRKALPDILGPTFWNIGKHINDGTRLEDVPIDRIAWCADHRMNTVPPDVVDNLRCPVELMHLVINGEHLYLVAEGNHRTERFVEAGRKTIPATVHDYELTPGVLKHRDLLGHFVESGKWPSQRTDYVTPEQAEVYKALGIVKDETVLAPTPKKRRFLGFGFGD